MTPQLQNEINILASAMNVSISPLVRQHQGGMGVPMPSYTVSLGGVRYGEHVVSRRPFENDNGDIALVHIETYDIIHVPENQILAHLLYETLQVLGRVAGERSEAKQKAENLQAILDGAFKLTQICQNSGDMSPLFEHLGEVAIEDAFALGQDCDGKLVFPGDTIIAQQNITCRDVRSLMAGAARGANVSLEAARVLIDDSNDELIFEGDQWRAGNSESFTFVPRPDSSIVLFEIEVDAIEEEDQNLVIPISLKWFKVKED